MTSKTLPGAAVRAGAAGTGGIVVLAHGGAEASKLPTSPVQASVLRMIPVAAAIREAVGGSGIEVRRARFRLRGWNGSAASPVRDLTELLDEISAESPNVPVVLVGHSTGNEPGPPGMWRRSRWAVAITACCAGHTAGMRSRPSSPG